MLIRGYGQDERHACNGYRIIIQVFVMVGDD